ncbi:MAG: bacillithiol biosynthesis BshC [Fibrobacteres bacterium]|nr:bacillithiol biosynthesis BshC [Fibrobacterota bacterium]
MRLSLRARLTAEDAAQRVLYAADQGAGTLGATSLSAAIYPGGHFRSEVHVVRRMAWLDSRPRPSGLQEFLRHENAFAPLAPEQRANLEAAASPAAVFMLTGQQPGLLGGPILWYYKALTCAALARAWARRLNRPVIPIFWVAGDDSDLAECNRVELLENEAASLRGDLRLDFPDAVRPLAMGERRVDPEALAALLKRLAPIWGPDTTETLGRAYPVPSTLASGFMRLAHAHLGREGILFVDGYSKHLRARARPVLQQAVDGWEAWQAALARGTAAAAAAGIPIQVEARPNAVHAFVLKGGERHRLLADRTGAEERIYLQDKPNEDARAALASLELSHDVFSRPLAAESLFPVLGHVLGPAELRYFAQLSPLFLEATGDMPLLHPRMTAAVAPASAWEAFTAEGQELSEALRYGPSALRARLADRAWRAHPAHAALGSATADRWLDGVRKIHDRNFKDEGPLARLERTVATAWKRYQHNLEKAVYAATARAHEPLFGHLRWLGNGLGQDRHLGLGSLLHVLGRDGFHALHGELDPLATELQLVEYEGR